MEGRSSKLKPVLVILMISVVLASGCINSGGNQDAANNPYTEDFNVSDSHIYQTGKLSKMNMTCLEDQIPEGVEVTDSEDNLVFRSNSSTEITVSASILNSCTIS